MKKKAAVRICKNYHNQDVSMIVLADGSVAFRSEPCHNRARALNAAKEWAAWHGFKLTQAN